MEKKIIAPPPFSPIHDHRTPHLIMARVGLRLAELTQPEAQGRAGSELLDVSHFFNL
jgi:hypothetical protein